MAMSTGSGAPPAGARSRVRTPVIDTDRPTISTTTPAISGGISARTRFSNRAIAMVASPASNVMPATIGSPPI